MFTALYEKKKKNSSEDVQGEKRNVDLKQL